MSLTTSPSLFNRSNSTPRIHLPSNTHDSNKNLLITKNTKNTFTIICKGAQNNQRSGKCTFLYDGNWGDMELVEHQKSHESLAYKDYSWLGFDVLQSYGNFSSRDEKRT